jgi:tripartite-type tricarboxylate transporter receptor subunit TctC
MHMNLQPLRLLNFGISFLVSVAFGPIIALAQNYPTRPITIIVGFTAGGPTDVGARILAEQMKSLLGQPVIVENVTGANGSIAVGRVVRAVPDGYTLSIGDLGTHVANQVTYALAYDLQKELQPIALLRTSSSIAAARKGMPARDLKGLIAWLRSNPEKATAGTGGVGGAEHLAGLIFQKVTGTRFQFIPYRGIAPAIQDMISGQIDMAFASPTALLPHIRSERLEAYAVMADRRMEAAPDIPSTDEAGAPGAYYLNWAGLWTTKGTPQDVVAKLSAAVSSALSSPVVKARYADFGNDIAPPELQSPEGLARFQKAEIDKWWPIIKAANIRAE